MNAFVALYQEIKAEREQNREVALVRVSLDAIPGSIVTLPVSPERLRLYAARYHGDDLVADLSKDVREMLVHPQDWHEALKETYFMGITHNADGKVTHVFGVPVQRDV